MCNIDRQANALPLILPYLIATGAATDATGARVLRPCGCVTAGGPPADPTKKKLQDVIGLKNGGGLPDLGNENEENQAGDDDSVNCAQENDDEDVNQVNNNG